MGGIYISNMKLPENCFQCPAHEWFDFGGENHGYQCPILRTIKAVSNCEARTKRRDNCPMIPVNEHGDLIERQAAYDSILNGMVMTGYQSRALDCIAEYNVPTVIHTNEVSDVMY